MTETKAGIGIFPGALPLGMPAFPNMEAATSCHFLEHLPLVGCPAAPLQTPLAVPPSALPLTEAVVGPRTTARLAHEQRLQSRGLHPPDRPTPPWPPLPTSRCQSATAIAMTATVETPCHRCSKEELLVEAVLA